MWRLLQDARVPGWLKLISLATLVYLLSPLDLVPDILVGPGQLDDLGILLLGLWLFLRAGARGRPAQLRSRLRTRMATAPWT